MIPVTETSRHGHHQNGATLCPAGKIAPTRSRFVRLSVKSGRFVCSGRYRGGTVRIILVVCLIVVGISPTRAAAPTRAMPIWKSG